ASRSVLFFFFFQAEDGIRDGHVTGVQTCALPIWFRSSLHIALVALDGGARFICHGAETRGLRIGSRVAIEAVDDVCYFSHLGARSEERRVGKECRSRCVPEHSKRK